MSDNGKASATAGPARRPILTAVLRGARFGAVIACVTMTFVGLIGLGISAALRAPTVASFFTDLAGMLGGVGLSALYGALVGAALMGVFAVIRWKSKPERN